MDEQSSKQINTKSNTEFNSTQRPPTRTRLQSDALSVNTEMGGFWWNDLNNKEQDPKNKWQYLEHNGVYFPELYKPKKLSIKYNNKTIQLDDYQEQIIIFWVESFGSEFHANPHFKKNFSDNFIETFKDRKEELGVQPNEEIDFDLFKFGNIDKYLQEKKQKKKEISKEEKLKKKQKNEEISKKYSYAIIDGCLEKVGNFRIEPRSIFKGRGEHPKSGMIKEIICPEDIILNISNSAPVPICPLPGRSWGEVISKKDCAWLASYLEKCTESRKYVNLGASSKLKGLSDIEKYEKARKLKEKIDFVRESYIKAMKSVDLKERQLGTATYIIDFLAIRAGNEKGDDKADTVGCCSLRVEHIEFLDDYQITLDFLGKDSIQYQNTIKIDKLAYDNLKLFVENKQKKDQIFDLMDTSRLNEYLQSLMKGLTAKVFRTFNASNTLQQQLKKEVIPKNFSIEQKLEVYNQANKAVAILCNHQKGVNKKQEESILKQEQKIKDLKKDLKKAKKENEKNQKLTKLKKRVQKMENDLDKRKDMLGIAVGTSKINYNDPRISVAWCKKNEFPIEKIFTKVLLEKFVWAMPTESTYEF